MRTPLALPPRRPRAVRGIAIGLATAALAIVSTGAAALPRDVEVRNVVAVDGNLSLAPATTPLTLVDGTGAWAVSLINGGEELLHLNLEVVELTAGPDGPVANGAPVAWARLPRDAVTLRPGERGDLDIGLAPSGGDLPAALALRATALGQVPVTALALAVVRREGIAASVSLTHEPGGIGIAADGPALVELLVRTTSPPRGSSDVRAGPLVVLPDMTRTVTFEEPRSLLGERVEAVAFIDGLEVARLLEDTSPRAGDVAVLALAATLTLGALLLVLGQKRRGGPTLPDS